jgi:hypothetical protein
LYGLSPRTARSSSFARLDRDDPDFAEPVREGRMGLAEARDAWLELDSSPGGTEQAALDLAEAPLCGLSSIT